MVNVLNIRLHFEGLPLRYNQKTTVSDRYLTNNYISGKSAGRYEMKPVIDPPFYSS